MIFSLQTKTHVLLLQRMRTSCHDLPPNKLDHQELDKSGKIDPTTGGNFAINKRYTEQQIAYAPKQAETGVSIQEVSVLVWTLKIDKIYLVINLHA